MFGGWPWKGAAADGMKLIFSEQASYDYLYWQQTDKKLLQRINALIRETTRSPLEGSGKPEPLKHALPDTGHAASTKSIAWLTKSSANHF
jgi:YoeB-like toxin of bacterial type II toxin-antitoxin system